MAVTRADAAKQFNVRVRDRLVLVTAHLYF